MKHFSMGEFTFSQTAARMGINNEPTQEAQDNIMALTDRILDPLRKDIDMPITITSGYRCTRLNHAIGGAKHSQHVKGQAADIVAHGMSVKELAQRIIDMELPFDQVIYEFGKWVHVSYSPAPRKDILTAYSHGKTHYLRGIKEV